MSRPGQPWVVVEIVDNPLEGLMLWEFDTEAEARAHADTLDIPVHVCQLEHPDDARKAG